MNTGKLTRNRCAQAFVSLIIGLGLAEVAAPQSFEASVLGRWGLGMVHSAQAAGESPLEIVLGLLRVSSPVRFAIRETVEGTRLAELLIGRPISSHGAGEAEDFARLAEELRRPERAELVRELAPRFAQLETGRGEAGIRAQARLQLSFLEENRLGLTGARARFLTGGLPSASAAIAPATRLKVAAVQYPVQGGRSFAQTLDKLEIFAREAQSNGAGLVVFPELFVLDRIDPLSTLTEAQQLAVIARDETPRYFARVIELSRELGMPILGGSYPRITDGGIVNTAQLAFPDGRVIYQDKLNLTPDEVHWGWRNGNDLQVFDTPWGRSTILICYDSQFPSISSGVAAASPELILVPSMTGAKGFHRVRWAAQARAVEQHAYVVVTGTVDAAGATASQYTAQAAFLTPQDEGFPGLLAEGPLNREAIVYGELDLAKLRESRRVAGLFSARDEVRRPAPIRVITPMPPR